MLLLVLSKEGKVGAELKSYPISGQFPAASTTQLYLTQNLTVILPTPAPEGRAEVLKIS